ncbi:MAG: hypothetical protein WC400_00610 [Patescibacteria group bacterium]|jgi:hypothetical protein
MNSNILKSSLWWLLKAAVLVSLSVAAIFLSSPEAEAATTLNGRLIPNYGTPSIKVDDSIVSVDNSELRAQIQNYIGFTIQFTCEGLTNGVVTGVSAMVLTDSGDEDMPMIWFDESVLPDDAVGGSVGGDVIASQPDKLEGWLIVRGGKPYMDISTPQLSGFYSEIQLLGLSSRLSDKLLSMKGFNPIWVVAEGKFDVITMLPINLWADGILLMQDGHDY